MTLPTMTGLEKVAVLLKSLPRAVVDKVLPLHDCMAAHNYVEQGKQFGKVVLSVP